MTTKPAFDTTPVGSDGFRRIIAAAFPNGFPAEQYWPLVTVLRQEMSFRSVAAYLTLVSGKSWPETYNDAMRVDSQPMCTLEDAAHMRAILDAHGYSQWLDED